MPHFLHLAPAAVEIVDAGVAAEPALHLTA
jgi:hypothetical protein